MLPFALSATEGAPSDFLLDLLLPADTMLPLALSAADGTPADFLLLAADFILDLRLPPADLTLFPLTLSVSGGTAGTSFLLLALLLPPAEFTLCPLALATDDGAPAGAWLLLLTPPDDISLLALALPSPGGREGAADRDAVLFLLALLLILPLLEDFPTLSLALPVAVWSS